MKMQSNCFISGFTSTDLLALVVTSALIVVVFFCALGRHAEYRKRVECQNNIGTIFSAMNAYACDNSGRFPDCTTNNPIFYGSLWPWDCNTNLADELMVDGAKHKSFYCPSNQGMNNDKHWNYWKYNTQSPVRVLGYVILFDGCIVSPQNLWRIDKNGDNGRSPAESELVADVVGSTYGDYTRIQGQMLDRTSHLYGNRPIGGNIGFVDGHVLWRSFANMQHRIVCSDEIVWDF